MHTGAELSHERLGPKLIKQEVCTVGEGPYGFPRRTVGTRASTYLTGLNITRRFSASLPNIALFVFPSHRRGCSGSPRSRLACCFRHEPVFLTANHGLVHHSTFCQSKDSHPFMEFTRCGCCPFFLNVASGGYRLTRSGCGCRCA